MRTRSIVILLLVVGAIATAAVVARSHGYRLRPIVRVIHGQR